jgi:hypothetical protein
MWALQLNGASMNLACSQMGAFRNPNNQPLYEEVDGIEYINVMWVLSSPGCNTGVLIFKPVYHSIMLILSKLPKGTVRAKESEKGCKDCR